MGKSTASKIFRDLGHPVWDADAAVHRLYAPGGKAVAPVLAAFPTALAEDGGIDRGALKAVLAATPDALRELEAIVHPLVAADRSAFIADHADYPLVVLDIPLLYEGGAEKALDGVAVVSAPVDVQRARVLARPGMTEDQFNFILSRQMADPEKRERADWIIPSDTMEGARAAIVDIITEIMASSGHA